MEFFENIKWSKKRKIWGEKCQFYRHGRWLQHSVQHAAVPHTVLRRSRRGLFQRRSRLPLPVGLHRSSVHETRPGGFRWLWWPGPFGFRLGTMDALLLRLGRANFTRLPENRHHQIEKSKLKNFCEKKEEKNELTCQIPWRWEREPLFLSATTEADGTALSTASNTDGPFGWPIKTSGARVP